MAAVKSQPLVVILKDEDPDKLKKLAKKPDELAEYKAYVADYNAQMQALVPKIWQFSPAVEFKQESEVAALRKAKGGQRGVLQHLDFQLGHRHSMVGAAGATGAAGNPAAATMSNAYWTSEHVSAIVLEVMGNGSQSQVWRVQLASGPIYSSDLIFSIRTIQQYVQARAAGRSGGDMRAELAQNGKKLRTKTLLFDEDDIKGKLTAADIKQAYPFPYQIVSRATIEAAVVGADARYACVRVMPVAENIMAQVAVDAADGTLLGLSLPNRMRMMGVGGGSTIGKGNLKDFAQAAEGK
ncbi:hypothetical protein [Hymenobacter coccineus]|uniref:hypothetical protein n=1 Tax=Hymenobacter coccineus TaxID=1908235 RepID=UPI000F7B79B1|nr:hypothetical protein [Hymenobacter coccineus]